jgi:hypothetical protein
MRYGSFARNLSFVITSFRAGPGHDAYVDRQSASGGAGQEVTTVRSEEFKVFHIERTVASRPPPG